MSCYIRSDSRSFCLSPSDLSFNVASELRIKAQDPDISGAPELKFYPRHGFWFVCMHRHSWRGLMVARRARVPGEDMCMGKRLVRGHSSGRAVSLHSRHVP